MFRLVSWLEAAAYSGYCGVSVRNMCLCGAYRCEGRSWYSAHRGKLWIAAASKEPSERDIAEVQQFYLALHGGECVHISQIEVFQ